MVVRSHVDRKWVLSPNSLCPNKEWNSSLISVKLSSLCFLSQGSNSVHNNSLKSNTWGSGVNAINKGPMTIEEVSIPRKYSSGSVSLYTKLEKIAGDNIHECPSYLAKDNSARYILLMENICEIENVLDDLKLRKLEDDILLQVKKLGALQLFHSSLERTFLTSDCLGKTIPVIEDSCFPNFHVNDSKNNIVIHSMKKRKRKLRKKATNNLSIISAPSSSLNAENQVKIGRRLQIARRESAMAVEVKEVSDLERIRLDLEEKIGRPANFARWSEAAAMDEKFLKQRLHLGWLSRDRLLRSAHSLVVYIAKSYIGMGLCFEDLIQAGNVGLLLGAERFDRKKGYRFSTYAQYWIRKSMSELVARHSRGIRHPASMDKVIKQIKKIRRSFSSNTRVHLQDHEIAESTGLSLDKIRLANRCSRPMGSFDQTLRGTWNIKFSEITPDTSIEHPETAVMRLHMRNDIHKLLKSLTVRERQVLMLRYGIEDGRCKSLSEIGQRFRLSKERIRKIEKTSLSKLRLKGIQGELQHYIDI